MTLLIPGMGLKPVSNSASIDCPHRVLLVHTLLDRIVLIPIEPRRVNKRLYFTGYKTKPLSEIQKQLDPKNPKLAIVKVKPRPDATATAEELDKQYLRKGQKKSTPRMDRERRWMLIQPLVSSPDRTLLFDPQVLNEQIAIRVKQLAVSPTKRRRVRRQIKECLNQFWAGGGIEGAVTPYRSACGARGKEKVQKTKLGRHNAFTRNKIKGHEGYVLSEHDKDIIRFSWRNYYHRGTTIPKAFRKMGREFYSVEVTDASGKTHSELLPALQRPTQSQFERWGKQQSPDQAAWKKQLSKTNAARIDRALLGNANDDIVAVGQRASVDGSPPDMHFVSTMRRLDRIGPAYRILIVDSLYRYIPGFYLGLHAPSSTTVNLAFLHAMTPKTKWLKFLGLDYQSADDWIPIAFTSAIADNTDARAEQVFISLDSIGCGQFFIPVARSDLNSAAEVSHHQLHRMVDHNMLGTTHGRRTSERGEKRADDLACHTIIEGIRESARAIHTHNTMPLDITPTDEMRCKLIDKGIPITPLSLTRMRIDEGKVARMLLDVDECRTHLMPITRGTFTAKGVRLLRHDTGNKRTFVDKVRYVSSHPIMLEKFKQAKNERAKLSIDYYDDAFRHDPYNPTEIFYRNPSDGELIRLELRSDDRDLPHECSYYDILDHQDRYALERPNVLEMQDQALSQMEAGQDESNCVAFSEYTDELDAEPKAPSKAKLRGNKALNREREDAQYQYGMPIQPPPDVNTSNSNAIQIVEHPPVSEPSIASTDPASPVSSAATPGTITQQSLKPRSLFASAIRKQLSQDAHDAKT